MGWLRLCGNGGDCLRPGTSKLPATMDKRIVILISGRGSNMEDRKSVV